MNTFASNTQSPKASSYTTEPLKTTPLFDMHVTLREPLNIGANHNGHRIIYDVESGYFVGKELNGTLKPSGGDWLLIHPDGSLTLDVRACLETHDNALIYMHYKGRWVIPQSLQHKVLSAEHCTEVSKDEYYQRNLVMFETSDERYNWLNNLVAVSQGCRTPQGISYNVMAVL
jgi:Protein of unknown function (DUF3237)